MLAHDVFHDLWSLAGWTMVHFLWLGTIVAAFAFAGRLILRNAAPNVRYLFSLICLALITAMPFVAARLSRDNFLAPALAPAARPSLPSSTTADANSPPLKGGAGGGNPFNANARTTTASPTPPIIDPHTTSPNPPALDPRPSNIPAPRASLLTRLISYLPWLWIIGTPLTFALLFTGLIGTHRLSRASTPIATGPIADALARLTTSLRITRRVTVAMCERVAAPVLIGIVRPMILLPPAALTGWSPDEIEMVLLHELAHIRRYDNVVNLAQRIIESLLFFHPAVWLISTWVRREREACCDAAVVARTQQPHAYATLLVNLAAQVLPAASARVQLAVEPSPSGRGQGEGAPRIAPTIFSPASPMAAGPLRTRIRHILQLEDDPMLITPKSLAITLATLLAAATLAFVYLPKIGQAEQPATEGTETTENTKKAANADSERTKQLSQTKNNLKQQMLALQMYHDTRKSYPPHAQYDGEQNKPLLSWRVLILPQLGEEKLYKEFHRNEPWDSEHNRKLIARMPTVFKNPKIDKPGFTNYLAVVGKECGFNGTPNGLRIQSISDGTANTIAIVEANADLAVEWTKPQNWTFDRAAPTKGLGQLWGDGWEAAFFDGSIRHIDIHKPADEVGIYFSRNGREVKGLKESANNVLNSEGENLSGPGMMEGGPSAEALPSAVPGAADKQSVTAVDWPKGVVFPSPKEGEISKRAWRLFHVKIVPATDEELQQVLRRGKRGGLKLVDFNEFPQFEEPFILTDIGSKPISRGIVTFDDLAKVLDTLEAQPAGSDDIVSLNGEAKNGHFQYNLRLPSSASAKGSTRFPTLEDQKLADLAWKRLGLELEPIAADDLQRVKALGYDGGLKVVSTGTIVVPNADARVNLVQGDILVGLHVWPTTNFKDIATVLNRDDLAELNPIKIYVVRDPRLGGTAKAVKDVVLSSRIIVQLAPTADRSSSRSNPYGPTPEPNRKFASIPFDPYALPSPAAFAPQTIESDLRRGLTCISLFNEPTKKHRESLAAAVNKVERQTPNPWRFVIYDVTASPKAVESFAASHFPTYIFWRDGVEVRRLTGPQSIEQLANTFDSVEFSRPNLGATFPPSVSPTSPVVSSVSHPAPPPLAPRSSPLAPQASLRYDGKPFEEWRNVWKTELSTEKRIEAVKALAAFGRAGYGPEAAAAILDIAAEYDYNRSGDLDKALRETIDDALIFRVPAKDWLPDLRARYDKAPEKWKSLALSVLKNARDADEADAKRNRDFLLQLSRSPDWSFTASAIGSLVKRYPDAPETTQRLFEVLKDKEHWLNAVEWFGKSKQYPPEVIDLVLHGDDKQQASVRTRFYWAPNSPAYASALHTLLEILTNDSKSADHLAAIRAIGGRTSDSLPQPVRDAALEAIVEKGPLNLRIAAAVALQNATGGRIQSFPLLEKKLGDLSKHNISRNDLRELCNKELSIQQNRE